MAIKKVIFYAVISNIFLFFLGTSTLSQGSKKNIQQQKKEEIPRPAYEVEVIVTKEQDGIFILEALAWWSPDQE